LKQFLLTAGPTPVPERVLLAMARPMTLSDLGYRIKPGSGVAAAQATFAESRRT
jgi:aspartate aminotransferase-like enzyme